MTPPILLAVPNVSEGRDQETIAAIGQAFVSIGQTLAATQAEGVDEPAPAVRLLDIHSDPDHHRSVFTVAARQGDLADALLSGARVAVQRIDVMTRAGGDPAQTGQHPHVGALDVAPVVYLDNAARGAACAEALVLADRIGDELEVPVFLYGELSERHDTPARSRADMRRGGIAGLTARMAVGSRPTPGHSSSAPDFGPPHMHPTAGATLVAARAPLVAFNLQLAAPATLADARAVAARIREGGAQGLPGVRAIGVALSSGLAQVSVNVERPLDITLAQVVHVVAKHYRVASAELVGLAPRAALEGFPQDIPMPGFDPARHVIENALRC
jgi:glutamate formiminotransferase/glutamate formiminotransferase/formiminotetrahydrofolate cyclodeaminase